MSQIGTGFVPFSAAGWATGFAASDFATGPTLFGAQGFAAYGIADGTTAFAVVESQASSPYSASDLNVPIRHPFFLAPSESSGAAEAQPDVGGAAHNRCRSNVELGGHSTAMPLMVASDDKTRLSPRRDGTVRSRKSGGVEGALACRRSTELSHTDDPYAYRDYRGPKNAVLDRLLGTPPEERNPRHACVCRHGRVYNWEKIFKVLGLNFCDMAWDVHEMLVYINAEDPMTRVTHRARFIKDAYSESHYLIREWLYEQYPELAEPIRKWHNKMSITKDHYIGRAPMDEIERWLNEHPEYRDGLLVFPRPTLWNRIGQQCKEEDLPRLQKSAVWDAICAGREFFIEEVAALFVPELASTHFDKLQKLLVHMAGPHVSRLSQTEVIRTISRWILTQFPELAKLADNPEWAKNTDALTERYGRTLGLIPVEWATGNMNDVKILVNELADAPMTWERAALPRIMKYLRRQETPPKNKFEFRPRDRKTGERRELRSGDEVRLLFKPHGMLHGDLTYLNEHSVCGIVRAVVRNERGEVVGIRLNHHISDGWPKEVIGARLRADTYWLADFDQEDSFIDRSGTTEPVVVALSDYSFPEHSGDNMLPIGQSDMQAPISIGDLLTLYTDIDLFHIVDAVVTGFTRDDDGRITGFSAYVDKNYRFRHATDLIRDAGGTPVAIEFREREKDGKPPEIERIELEGEFELYTFKWTDIQRAPGHSRFSSPSYDSDNGDHFRLPQSHLRVEYDESPTFGRSDDTTVAFRQDSGDFTLRIGREEFFGDPRGKRVEQAPVSPGDEVLLSVNKKGSLLGFGYERILVASIVIDGDGKAIGLAGYRQGASVLGRWLFADINRDSSHIETNPWSGNRANSIPGAYEKRTPYDGKRSFFDRARFEAFINILFGRSTGKGFKGSDFGMDIFGYRFGGNSETPSWQDRPITMDDWLEENNLARVGPVEVQWAYWVLQVTPCNSNDEIKKAYRRLAARFHTDIRPDLGREPMQCINEAWGIMEKYLGIS